MKKTSVRRGLAWILVLVMLLSAVPFGVLAEGESAVQESNVSLEETPGGVDSKQEEPVQEVPGQGKSAQEEPKQEEPAKEEPKQEEPKVQDTQDEGIKVETAQECLCEDAVKCTKDTVNKECPVCFAEDADLDKVCKGKPQEQLTAEAETKRAAEEEAARKAAEEEAAKKAAEETAQKASEEAVKNVQTLIDALPDADTITEENRDEVAAKLDAIDDAKLKLTDEQQEKLDFTKYRAVISAINVLDGTPGAEMPDITDDFPSKEEMLGGNGPALFDSQGNPERCFSKVSKDGVYVSDSVLTLKNEKYFIYWNFKTLNGLQFDVDSTENLELGKSYSLTNNGNGKMIKFSEALQGTNVTITIDATKYDENTGIGVTITFVKAAPFTITFDAQNSSAATSMQTKANGQLESLAEEPQKDGYDFKGWYLNTEYTESITTNTVFSADTTVYAKWERTKPTVSGDGSITVEVTDEELNEILGSDSDTLTINSSAVTDISELIQKLELDGNTPFKAVNVELLRNGDENQKLTELSRTACFAFDVSGLNLSILRVQRNHNGWASMPRLAAKPTDGQTEGYYLDGNILYIYSKLFSTFAAYSAPYTVTFDPNGGSKTPAKQTTDANDKLTSLPDAGRKEGYNFAYWYQKDAAGNETEVKANDTIFTADTTVYAKWTAWSYTVTFDGNGGKVKNGVLNETEKDVPAKYGSEVTPPDFVKDYYTVSAWARNADGTEKVESPILNLATKDGDKITLYAVWEYAPRTVTFDANGVDNNGKATKGTVTEDGTEKASVERKTQESPINTLKTLPVPNAQEGYYFEGWYYKDRANKEQPVEVGKTEFTADTTVYAKWKVFEPVTVTLKCQRGTMRIDGKDVSTGTMQTKWPGVLDGTLPTAARSGYKFEGWYTYAGVKVDENTVFLRDTTVYARWKSAVSRTGNPKTGDQIALEAAVAVLVIAAVGLGAAVIIKKKQNKK